MTALYCGRRRRQERVETLLDDGIALARRLLEAGPVENLHSAAAVTDEAGGLHRLRCKRYGFPIGAHDVREKFVRIRESFAAGAIMHHQEPSARPLFGRVHRIARDRLLDLRKQRLRITDKEIAHVLATLELILQQFDRAANRMARELHNAAVEGDPAVHCGEKAKRAFPPYVGSLDRGAILQN